MQTARLQRLRRQAADLRARGRAHLRSRRERLAGLRARVHRGLAGRHDGVRHAAGEQRDRGGRRRHAPPSRDVLPLGFKNHNLLGNELDPSDRDDGVAPARNWPVFGMYMPDAIAAYDGRPARPTSSPPTKATSREWGSVVGRDARRRPRRSIRRRSRTPRRCRPTPRSAASTSPRTLGDTDGDADFDEILYALRRAARSRSGTRERRARLRQRQRVRAAHSPQRLGARSSTRNHTAQRQRRHAARDDKGPEPEAVTLADIDGSDVRVHRPRAHRRRHGLRRDAARDAALRQLRRTAATSASASTATSRPNCRWRATSGPRPRLRPGRTTARRARRCSCWQRGERHDGDLQRHAAVRPVRIAAAVEHPGRRDRARIGS